jgi:hypothetical protein
MPAVVKNASIIRANMPFCRTLAFLIAVTDCDAAFLSVSGVICVIIIQAFIG